MPKDAIIPGAFLNMRSFRAPSAGANILGIPGGLGLWSVYDLSLTDEDSIDTWADSSNAGAGNFVMTPSGHTEPKYDTTGGPSGNERATFSNAGSPTRRLVLTAPSPASTSFTKVIRVKPNNISDSTTRVFWSSYESGVSASDGGIYIAIRNANLRLYYDNGSGFALQNEITNYWSGSPWATVGIRSDRSDDTLDLFTDGVIDSTVQDQACTAELKADGDWSMFGHSSTVYCFMDMTIAAAWGRALTDAEMSTVHTNITALE